MKKLIIVTVITLALSACDNDAQQLKRCVAGGINLDTCKVYLKLQQQSNAEQWAQRLGNNTKQG
ncbi:lipoprotein [Lactobacillus gasseri]|uniref:lipoprotein n=1 Tax=Lactobacillus gasseri TaxID=1596 RepID=UPI00254F4843|nr:lipoprotein [Lactobacillus gasseri]MDK7117423.1 lipoprotein [Lactobacillus gasseri]